MFYLETWKQAAFFNVVYQCCSRGQRWGLQDTLHMVPFEINGDAALRLDHGVFHNCGAKQVEPGTAFDQHLKAMTNVNKWPFDRTD